MSDELKELLRKAMLTDGGAKRKTKKMKASGSARSMDLNLLGPVADTSTIKQLVKQAIQEELAVESTGRMAVSGMGLGGSKKKKGKSMLKAKLGKMHDGAGLGGGPVGGRKRGDLTQKEKKLILSFLNSGDRNQVPGLSFRKGKASKRKGEVIPHLVPYQTANRAIKYWLQNQQIVSPFNREERTFLVNTLAKLYRADESDEGNLRLMFENVPEAIRYVLTHEMSGY